LQWRWSVLVRAASGTAGPRRARAVALGIREPQVTQHPPLRPRPVNRPEIGFEPLSELVVRAPPLDQHLPQDCGCHSHHQEHHACSTHHVEIHGRFKAPLSTNLFPWVKVQSPSRLCRTTQNQVLYNATPTTSSPARPFGGPSRRISWPAIYPWPIQFLSRRTGAPEVSTTGRDQNPSVHPGSVSHRDHRDTNGHQRSPTAKRDRRSTSVQLKQRAQRRLADQIVVLKGQ